ncbi:uncharacterized protein LOC132707666 [Cylas formicarius]|uniref:uncharacterized protein LOC132707666 n=1 Tax=Cylas formicarius TaxID=197179 RepID=UPI0029585D56|nr:uncharacterized protein LOC132707666 [Cylas formicarius]
MAYLIALAIIAVAAAIFGPRIFAAYKKRRKIAEVIDKLPGAPWYPILGTTLPLLKTSREDLFRHVISRHDVYGPVYRSWLLQEPVIHICKAEHIEVLLKSSVNINKGQAYAYFEPWLGQGLLTGGGKKWKTHRKLITPAFHFSILDKFAETFVERADDLVRILESKVGKGYFDVNPYVTKCALDIIAETSMGRKINAMKDPESQYVDAIVSVCEIASWRYANPIWANDFLFQFTSTGKRFYKNVKYIEEFTQKIIMDKRAEIDGPRPNVKVDELGRKEKQSFIDILLSNQGQDRFTDREIIHEINTFMFAGQDTSSTTTALTLFALGNDPRIQAKVHEELDSVLGVTDGPITSQDVASLEYLDRVVKETLRAYSFVPEIARVLEEDIVLDDLRVPAGVTVIMDLYNLHHDPEHYPDPEKFDPDRFLPEASNARHPYAYIPFSAGPRNCIGQKFGIRNAKTMLASILRKFRVRSRDKPEDMRYYLESVLRPQNGINMELELPSTLNHSLDYLLVNLRLRFGDTMSYLVALAVLVVTVVIFGSRFLEVYRRKRKIAEAIDYYPGEKWYPIVGTGLTFMATSREDIFDFMTSRHKKYGPIFRNWLQGEPIVHICKAEHAELLLKSNVNIDKDMRYRYFAPWLGTGLLLGGGNKWRTHRKLITPAFHFSILDKFAEIFAERADDLVHILEDKVGKGYFDVNPYVTKCALDIIAETSMGKKVNAMKDPNSKYLDAIARLCEIASRRYTNPIWANDFLFKFTEPGKRFFEALNYVNGITLKIISEKRAQFEETKSTIRVDEFGRKERQAFIDLLLTTQDQKRFTDEEIIEEVNTFMFAGQDTSSITTGFTLFALGNEPEIQAKVHEELDAIFQGSDRIITPQDVASMDYLDRVVKETMRYYYFVPEIGRRLLEELVLDGHRIPAGTTVILDLYELHHDPEHFPEPFKFDPDRFLPEEVAKRHVYAYVPFSAGPRNCVGQKFGLRNAKTMLASILRKFKVKSRDKPQDLKYYIEAVLRPQQGLHIELELRN